MKNEKKFLKPEAELIEFVADDIIVTSGEEWWGHGNLGDIDDVDVP